MSRVDPDETFTSLDELFDRKPRQRSMPGLPATTGTPGSGYAAKALDAEVEALSQATEGSRNDTLNTCAFNLGQLVGAGLLDYGHVWGVLQSTALGIGLEPAETFTTLRSGLEGGMREPRQVPELVREDHPVRPATVLEEEEPTETIGDRFPALDWEALWADETKDEWIVEPLLPARRLVALFSPPKVGKSLLMLDLAVHVARGLSFLGSPEPDEPRVVLYVDFENDPRGDVRTRLQAMGVGPADLGNLKYLSYPTLAKLDTLAGGYELLAVAQHYGATVVVIDTISRAVGGEENDNDTWLSFYRNTGVLLKAAGIACIRLDHTGKDESKGMRGGSAKYGDVDAVWAMARVSDYTFRLDCTANRLPIPEKHIVVDRQVSPLSHVLNMAGVNAAYEAAYPLICKVLDDAGVPNDAGAPTCWPYFNGTGMASKRAVEYAVAKRRKRAQVEQPLFTPPTPYADN